MENNKTQFSLKYFIYAVIVLISVVLFAFLISWAAMDADSDNIEIVECKTIVADGVRREYIAGETVSPEGLSLKTGSTTFTDCTVSVDTSSAGLKRAVVSHAKGSKLYQGYFDITVYAVRHCEIAGLDNSANLHVDGEGNLVCENEVIKLDLNAHPEELNVEDENMPKVVTLSPDMYVKTTTRDENNPERYTLEFDIGSLNVSYTCVKIGAKVLTLGSSRRILELTNRNEGGSEKLTLYVTKITGLGGDGSDAAEGVYIFTDASGAAYAYNFKYYAVGWASYFDSASVNEDGFFDWYIGDETDPYVQGMGVNCRGVEFATGPKPWHRAVLDNENI